MSQLQLNSPPLVWVVFSLGREPQFANTRERLPTLSFRGALTVPTLRLQKSSAGTVSR